MKKRIMSSTLTEWLWKSVTMISLFLFTAAKCGPSGQKNRHYLNKPQVFCRKANLAFVNGNSFPYLPE